jgi:phosphatidylglycerophosphate synthase
LIQLFGLWSCVDGEVARLTKSESKLGDFYDTMTDRSAEFMIFAGVLFSMPESAASLQWGTLFFGYMGMVFLITASSEKYRSVYQKNYPKSEHERVFSWLCAGSDTRFLYLSLAILGYRIDGQTAIIEWFMIILTILLAVNFVFRMWVVSKLSRAASDI